MIAPYRNNKKNKNKKNKNKNKNLPLCGMNAGIPSASLPKNDFFLVPLPSPGHQHCDPGGQRSAEVHLRQVESAPQLQPARHSQ